MAGWLRYFYFFLFTGGEYPKTAKPPPEFRNHKVFGAKNVGGFGEANGLFEISSRYVSFHAGAGAVEPLSWAIPKAYVDPVFTHYY